MMQTVSFGLEHLRGKTYEHDDNDREFRTLEHRTVSEVALAARWRAHNSAPSTWVVPAPAQSVEIDDFAGKIGVRRTRLTGVAATIESERAMWLGRLYDDRLEGLGKSPEARALRYFRDFGGARSPMQPIGELIGGAFASAKQLAAWKKAKCLATMCAERGNPLWKLAVALWCARSLDR